jgi:hypothetical protein
MARRRKSKLHQWQHDRRSSGLNFDEPSSGGFSFERPACLRCEYWCAYLTTPARIRLRVHWAPGIPRALCFKRAKVSGKARAQRAARIRCMTASLRGALATKQSSLRHSGMVRRTRPQMRNYASGNLEILRCAIAHRSSMRSLSSGRPKAGPVGIAPECCALRRIP